jgi:hypothetical protein
MNKTAIKNFAVWARQKLISGITYEAKMLGITENGIAKKLPQSTDDMHFYDVGTAIYAEVPKDKIKQRESLAKKIKEEETDMPSYKDAFYHVVEEIAYTWFNRLIAIRFMEVNDYLPSEVRVLSSKNKAKIEPDIVTDPFDTDLEFTSYEQDKIIQLKDDNELDELFRMLFIKQCNKLHDILPELFEKTDDYSELLLTISFTDKDGIVYRLVHDIDEDDFNVEKEGQIQIIGWLYQYYNIEPKDKVFQNLKKNIKISKENIPAATQLFTPHWIVQYMVENSLGRIPIHNLKYGNWSDEEKTKIDSLKSKWKYYIDDAEQTDEIVKQFRSEESNKYGKGDLPPYVGTTFLDPCMGSGHILVYAFDVFMDIYRMQGYTDREAVRSIILNNLYGLEIDDRAAQLAYFAIMMKARSYDRRFLTRTDDDDKPDIPKPNVCSIQESNRIKSEYIELFGELKPLAQKLLDEFSDAKCYGSILNPSITKDEIKQLEEKYAEIDNTHYDNLFDIKKQTELRPIFGQLITQAKLMIKKYDVVCTNPPYMGGGGMTKKLSEFVKKYYPQAKADLYSCFIVKCEKLTSFDGYYSVIVPQSFMFLSSFEDTRTNIYVTGSISTMAHMGFGAFGNDFGTTSFCIKRTYLRAYKGVFIRLTEYRDIVQKGIHFFDLSNRYTCDENTFFSIPGCPFAYWLSDEMKAAFTNKKLCDYAKVCKGNDTGCNDIFLRYWFETEIQKMNQKWFPYNKGGNFRKWYGNRDYVINWENDGLELREFAKSNIRNRDYHLKEGFTWSTTTAASFSCRYTEGGFLFDSKGCMGFCFDHNNLKYIIGALNTKVYNEFLKIITPTVDYNPGPVSRVPIKIEKSDKENIENIVDESICYSVADWDSFETSWDFAKHPFVINGLLAFGKGFEKIHFILLTDVYRAWKNECNERFNKLKANEEELNRIFIDIYGLQDELTPDVADKDITVHRIYDTEDNVPESMKGSKYVRTKRDEIVSLISYAVGCMFGRYSLDKEGLVFAGGNFDEVYMSDAICPSDNLYPSDSLLPKNPEYTKLKTDDGLINLSFYPDYDNVIPITDEEYFEDDIVGLLCSWLKKVYGEDTLEENLDFIADALGNKGKTSREVIRNYFLTDFIKDHIKTYQKRPIYWLFDSGKQNGFKALVYMHRWNADTIGNVRVEYLHRIQRVYEKEITRMQEIIDNSHDNKEISNATKRKEKLQKQIKETKDYDAKIAHLALSRIDIDLDDGVKVNYEKVQTADGKKMQILAKI